MKRKTLSPILLAKASDTTRSVRHYIAAHYDPPRSPKHERLRRKAEREIQVLQRAVMNNDETAVRNQLRQLEITGTYLWAMTMFPERLGG